jgi:hypothetical protein
MKTITITVDPKGQSKVETTGFAGAECRDASRFLERALGRATGEILTSDFYRIEHTRQGLQEGR